MATRCRLFRIFPPLGERSATFIEPSSPEHQVPQGYSKIPGYIDRMQQVVAGQRDPWWGGEYVSTGPFPADFVEAMPALYAASDRLRVLLEDNGVAGVRFFPVRVNGTTPMHLMVVDGRVDVNPQAFELQLLDGAEIGLYRLASLHVSPRVVALLKAAKIRMYSRCAVPATKP